MDHQRQVGGSKKVRCTTFRREVIKNVMSTVTLLAAIGFGISHRDVIRRVLLSTSSAARGSAHGVLAQARTLLTG